MASKNIFQFKQFQVDQTDCAMKINTDGVLLAASTIPCHAQHILDIGTGTGVIALMLAQLCSTSTVEAVEIDASAARRAKSNFLLSPFYERLILHSGSFENIHVQEPFDLIISNPPFFTDSLQNPDERRKLARHTDLFFFDMLLRFACENLVSGGYLRLILPLEIAVYLVDRGAEFGLFLLDRIDIRSYSHTPFIRQVITLQKCNQTEAKTSVLTIYEKKGEYTAAYKALLSPFFLAF